MSHLNPGLISAYNSLTDKHLAGYFSNSRIRRHLQRVGLITRSGRIVPDKEYRTKLMQRVHQRHVRECLAQAIFHKVLDMERVHQIEIKRRLEEFARRERVHKIKVERSKRYEEELIQILSPRPPTGPRAVRTQHSVPEGEPSESSESPGSSRPNTAPGTMQRPARLQPITSSSTAASLRRRPPRRHRGSADWQPPLDNITDNRDPQRRGTTSEFCRDVSPYCLPVINNFVTPVPPTTKRRDRGSRVTSNGTVRGRRLRSTNAPSGADLNEEPLALRSSVQQSRVGVNMLYFGKTVHLSRDLGDMRDEVKVFQQHCGGENLCVFKGRLQEGEAFHFVSRRHRGFPFSLTFFLNGLQVERISSCCEFKHRKGTRLAGRHKHFGFTGVEGASPCYKCIIAMGLDKKPTPPPPKRAANETETERTSSPSDTHKETAEEEEKETEEVGEKERAVSTVDPETPQPQDMETDDKEETVQEDKPRDDYEEDFEADDEAEESSKAKETEAPSPSSDKEEKEKKQASDSEHDAGDARTSRSHSSSSGSERLSEDEGDEEDHRRAGGSEDPPASEDAPGPPREEPPATEDTPDPQMPAPASPPAPAAAQDVQSGGGPGGATGEFETGAPPRTEGKGHEDTPAPAPPPGEAGEGEGVPEETGRAKSVQEKLAEAILMEGQCHSEPELSDTTTEEDESTGKDNQQGHEDAPPIECETSETQPLTQPEETEGEASVVGEELTVVEQKDAKEELTVPPINKAGEEKSEKDKAEEETPASETGCAEETTKAEKEDSEEKEDKEASPLQETEEKEEAKDQEATPQADGPAKPVEADAAEEVEEAVEEAVKEVEKAVEEPAEEVEEAVKEVEEAVEEAVKEVEEPVEEVKEAVKEAVKEVEEVKEAVEEAVKEVEEVKEAVEEAVKEMEEAVKEVEEAVEEVEEAVKEVEAGVEADSQTEPEAKSTEANEESPASEPEGKEDVETALPCGADEQKTAADSQTADSSAAPPGELTDVGEAPVSDSGKPGADEATVEMAGAQGPGEGSSSSSEPSGAAAVLQQTEAAETRGTKIDHHEPVEDLHEESASHEDAGKKSGGEMESFRGRRGDDTEGEGGSVTSGPQNNVEKDKTEKEGGGEDDNAGKSDADQVEATEEGDVKAKELTGDTTEREEEQEGRKAEEVSAQTAGATGEPAEHTERDANVEAKDPLEGTDDKASDAADEENAQKEEKPEKDKKETEDGEHTQHKADEEGSEKQVTDIESSMDAKESRQSTEDQAEQNADQVEESEAQKQATETAEEQAKTMADQDPVKEAEETSDESHVETENAHEADKAKGIQEDKAEETKGNVLGSDGDQGEHEGYKGKVEDENGVTRQRSSEIKENNEDQGDEGSQGKNTDPKDSEEQKEEKEKDRSKDHEDKDHEGKDHEDKDHEGKDHEDKDHELKDNKHEEGNIDQGPSVDQVPTEANMKEEQAELVSEVVEAVESQEAKQLPDKKDEIQDKLSEINTTKESDQNHGVIVDSPEGQTLSSESIVMDTADNIDNENVEAIPESALNTDDKHPDSDHDSAVAVEPTAVNGEHSADTEEGSKPSEEAESVVFKPEAEQAQPPVHQAAQSSVLVKDTPGLLEVNETNEKGSLISDVLESEDNRDNLVTDWVTLHQTSNYFEKFVEPLDDMKELPSGRSGTDENGLGIMRSESPPQNITRSERSEENVEKNEKETERLLDKSNNSDDNTKLQIDLRSNHSEGQEVTELTKDKQESKELTEVTPAIPTSEADQSTEESARAPALKGETTLDNTGSSAGDRDQDAPTKGTSENGHSSRTETEDIGENNNIETTITQCTAEPATELQQEEGAVREEPEVEEKQTTVEEINTPPLPNKTDGCHEVPEGPEASSRPSRPPPEAQRDRTKETTESREADATPITDLLAVSDLTSSSASDNGNGEGAQNTPEVQSRPPDRSDGLNGDSKEVQLIEDFKPSVSKDQLSAYRVEETSLFGRTSYPQFTTQTGSGY